MSTKSGPLRAAGYDGYMVYICDEVLKQMLISQDGAPKTSSGQIQVLNVDKEMQAEEEPGADRFALLANGRIDILCDPASINRNRVRRFAVSPPLFLTGLGFLQLKAKPASAGIESRCKNRALIGVVGSTNAADDGITAILRAGEWKQYRREVIDELRSGKQEATLTIRNCKEDEPPKEKKPPQVWYAPSHTELANRNAIFFERRQLFL